jgi:hypothetical protein
MASYAINLRAGSTCCGGRERVRWCRPADRAGSAIFEARPPIDLSNARLRTLAAALGPAYVRVSGTWANTVYFADADQERSTTYPGGVRHPRLAHGLRYR